MAKASKAENQNDFQSKLKSLEQRFGIGCIIQGSAVVKDLETVPTGSFNLDIATGIGGYPVGKMIEFFGPESVGKSTVCSHAIANFQKLGKCVLVDTENSFDRKYAEALGVDVEQLYIVQPDCAEDAYNITTELISTGEVRLVVLDSHTAAIPKKMIEGEVGESTIGLQARVNSIAIAKIKPMLLPNRCTFILTSQLRTKIGQMYGDPNSPTGGNAIKFYADMRFKFSKVVDKDNQQNATKIEIAKNKCAAPFKIAEFNICWGTGIDRPGEILDLAVKFDIVHKAGAWFSYKETKIGQGFENTKQFLLDNEEMFKEVEQLVLQKIKE